MNETVSFKNIQNRTLWICITAFFMGPLIAFFNRHVAQPLLGAAEAR